MKKALKIWLCVTLSVAAVIGTTFVCGEIGRRLRPVSQTISDAGAPEPEHILKIYTYANIPGESGETRSLRELTEPVCTGRLLRKTTLGERYPEVGKPETVRLVAEADGGKLATCPPRGAARLAAARLAPANKRLPQRGSPYPCQTVCVRLRKVRTSRDKQPQYPKAPPRSS